jgi:hypothetical protein
LLEQFPQQFFLFLPGLIHSPSLQTMERQKSQLRLVPLLGQLVPLQLGHGGVRQLAGLEMHSLGVQNVARSACVRQEKELELHSPDVRPVVRSACVRQEEDDFLSKMEVS